MTFALTAPVVADAAGQLNFEQIASVLNALDVALLYGSGVPAASLGSDGAFYLRSDGSSGSYIYHRASGSWTAIL